MCETEQKCALNLLVLKSALRSDCWVFILYEWNTCIITNVANAIDCPPKANDISVNVGDSVKQGDVIAKAGTNTIDALLNNHLHFSLMKNGKVINPNKYYSQTLKNID